MQVGWFTQPSHFMITINPAHILALRAPEITFDDYSPDDHLDEKNNELDYYDLSRIQAAADLTFEAWDSFINKDKA